MQKIRKFLQSFTSKQDSGSGVQPLKQTSEELPVKYYQHIVELPLWNFIQVDINANLSALIISGFPNEEQLASAWVTIQQEYADASGNSEHVIYRELYKEVSIMLLEIQSAEKLVELLTNVNSLYFQKELNELLRTNYKFDWNDREGYVKELQRAANKIKALRNINYALKKAELDVLNQKNSTGEKMTTEYYYVILYKLEDHAGFKLGDKISVHEFITRLKQFNDFCEKQKAKT